MTDKSCPSVIDNMVSKTIFVLDKGIYWVIGIKLLDTKIYSISVICAHGILDICHNVNVDGRTDTGKSPHRISSAEHSSSGAKKIARLLIATRSKIGLNCIVIRKKVRFFKYPTCAFFLLFPILFETD